jgi:hypothetical protein
VTHSKKDTGQTADTAILAPSLWPRDSVSREQRTAVVASNSDQVRTSDVSPNRDLGSTFWLYRRLDARIWDQCAASSDRLQSQRLANRHPFPQIRKRPRRALVQRQRQHPASLSPRRNPHSCGATAVPYPRFRALPLFGRRPPCVSDWIGENWSGSTSQGTQLQNGSPSIKQMVGVTNRVCTRREFSGSARLRGGAGRTRTNH